MGTLQRVYCGEGARHGLPLQSHAPRMDVRSLPHVPKTRNISILSAASRLSTSAPLCFTASVGGPLAGSVCACLRVPDAKQTKRRIRAWTKNMPGRLDAPTCRTLVEPSLSPARCQINCVAVASRSTPMLLLGGCPSLQHA
jgi:hypothetical protein